MLDTLRTRVAQSRLPDGWASATAALRELLPATWRAALAVGQAAVGLRLGTRELHIYRLDNERVEPMGALPNDAQAQIDEVFQRLKSSTASRWLLLDPTQVLRRTLALPLAAEPRLHDVLAHEIDRQTPFTADQVWFAGRVLARDPVARQLQVELVVLPKARFDDWVKALGPLANGLAGVDVLAAEQQRLGINLLPKPLRFRRVDPAQRLQWELLACALILGVASLFVALNNREQALKALRERVELANAEVRQVRALRNQLQASAEAANFLAKASASQPAMLALIADLTHRIPDDTALDKLAVNDSRLVLVGLSKSPASLVGLLQDSPLLSKPALAGAVQTDNRSGRERFTLTATVRLPNEERADGKR